MNDEKCKLPCADHIRVFQSTCAFFVLFMTILVGYVVANENRRVDTLRQHERENISQFDEITEKMNAGFLKISTDLAEIKGKLGIGK